MNFGAHCASHDDPEITLGFAKYYEMRKSYTKALQFIDECIVKYQWFEPALSEKALLLLKTGEWDICTDTADRALRVNGYASQHTDG